MIRATFDSAKRFHIVLISTKGYHLAASHATMAEAVKDILGRSVRSFGCVLRDGTTGKRYSISECKQMTSGDVAKALVCQSKESVPHQQEAFAE